MITNKAGYDEFGNPVIWRVNVTWLESYRRAVDMLYQDDSEETAIKHEKAMEELKQQVLGKPFVPSDAMYVGSAFDSLLQKQPFEFQRHIEGSEWIYEYVKTPHGELPINFREDAIREAIKKLPERMTHQVKFLFPTTWDRYVVHLSGIADGMYGVGIIENKTTGRPKSYIDYVHSLQWKAYCMMSNSRKARYNVWQVQYDSTFHVDVVKFDYYEYLYYEELGEEVNRYLRDFMTWCKYNDLLDPLEERTASKPFLLTDY